MNKSIIETQGTELTGMMNINDALTAADLNWGVKHDSVGGMDTGIVMPGKKILYRDDNNAALGIVGDGYKASDPREFIKTQHELADALKGEVTRAGFITERSQAFAFIKVANIEIPRGERKVGDPLSAYVYSVDGWDGGTPRSSRLFIERLACLNGMTSRQLKASLWVSHTKNSDARFAVKWGQFKNDIASNLNRIQAEFAKLAQEKMTQDAFDAFLKELIPGDGTKAENRRGEVGRLFHDGVGVDGSTRWDAYNAVTEYATHHRTYRNTDRTDAGTNRFMGVLEGNTLADKALVLLG